MFLVTILPADIATMTAYVGSVYTGIAPLVALAIGAPLAFWAIKRVIGLIGSKTK